MLVRSLAALAVVTIAVPAASHAQTASQDYARYSSMLNQERADSLARDRQNLYDQSRNSASSYSSSGTSGYHNNSDYYPKSTASSGPSLNSGPNYGPILNPPFHPVYPPEETAADRRFIRDQQHDGQPGYAYDLALCYYGGIGTRQDKPVAYARLSRLADHPAQFKAAEMEYAGDGIAANMAMAVRRMENLSRSGEENASAWLADHHYLVPVRPNAYAAKDLELDNLHRMMFGAPAERNVREAIGLLQTRAAEGYPRAKFDLGRA